jgi:hypothetical protein
VLEVGHGRATYWHGPCHHSDFNGHFFLLKTWHGRAIPSTGRATFLVLGASEFFNFLVFFESNLDNYLQNNLKQRKTKEKQLNAWVASHEALF